MRVAPASAAGRIRYETRQAAPADLPQLNEMYHCLARQMAGQGHASWDRCTPTSACPATFRRAAFRAWKMAARQSRLALCQDDAAAAAVGWQALAAPRAVSGPPWRGPACRRTRGGQPGASGGRGASLRAGRAVSAPFCCESLMPCPYILSKEWLFQSKRLPQKGM